jgi:hypothetical protein
MTRPIDEAIKAMISEDKDICSKCGRECEYGWDAHVLLTPNGCITVCSECDPRNKSE